MILKETFVLSNGIRIPKLGLGTWQIKDASAEEAVSNSFKVGYRLIDTAESYQNEHGVGNALKDSPVHRDEVFVTSKIRAEYKSYAKAKKAIEKSLKALDTPYIDLMLIHAPRPWFFMFFKTPKKYYKENLAVWKAMEEAYKEGKIKAIGVSNFAVQDLENLMAHAEIKPMVNQVMLYISNVPEETLRFCHDNNILVEAYSPLGTGKLLDNQDIKKIADRYGVSIAQLCIRYCLQRGALPLPKASGQKHQEENAKVDFEISQEDMEALNHLKHIRKNLW